MSQRPEDLRARAHLHATLGEPGSGRLRYAAAMHFQRRGQLSPEVLEVYRVCSADDSEDPAPLLAARGLSVDLPCPDAPPVVLAHLRDEIDRYLGTHFGPGIAETRALIAAWREMAGSLPPGRTNPVVDAWMEAALAELAPAMPSLAAAIGAAVPHLDWITYDLYPPDEIGPAFARGHAFATLVGEGAPFPAEEFDLGIFIVAPDVLYRDHHHPAPELYAPLTGPHGWRFGGAGPLTIKAAHVPVWNDPGTVHLTKVGPSPFLSLFAWTQDVTLPAQVFPAQDWAELEALRIET